MFAVPVPDATNWTTPLWADPAGPEPTESPPCAMLSSDRVPACNARPLFKRNVLFPAVAVPPLLPTVDPPYAPAVRNISLVAVSVLPVVAPFEPTKSDPPVAFPPLAGHPRSQSPPFPPLPTANALSDPVEILLPPRSSVMFTVPPVPEPPFPPSPRVAPDPPLPPGPPVPLASVTMLPNVIAPDPVPVPLTLSSVIAPP